MEPKKGLTLSRLLQELPAVIAIIFFVLCFFNYYVKGGIPLADWLQARRIEMEPLIGLIGIITMVQFYFREYRTRETLHGYITAMSAIGTLIITFVYCELTGLETAAPIYTELYEIFFTKANALLSELYAVSMITGLFFLLRIRKGRAGIATAVIMSGIILTFFSDTDLGLVLGLGVVSDFANWLVVNVWGPIGWPFAGMTSGTLQILAMFMMLSRIFVLKEKIRG